MKSCQVKFKFKMVVVKSLIVSRARRFVQEIYLSSVFWNWKFDMVANVSFENWRKRGQSFKFFVGQKKLPQVCLSTKGSFSKIYVLRWVSQHSSLPFRMLLTQKSDFLSIYPKARLNVFANLKKKLPLQKTPKNWFLSVFRIFAL